MKLAAILLLFVASFFVGGVLRIAHDTTPPAPVTKPAPTATPSDPLAWYKSLPTATPGCPKSVAPGLEPFYRNCPNLQRNTK